MLRISDLKENFEYPDAKGIEFKEEMLFIKQYLPVFDKYVMIHSILTLLDLENKKFNPIMAETLFDLNIVESYTNIIFADEDHQDFFKTFDILQITGLIDIVISNIPVEEFEELKRLLDEAIVHALEYSKSLLNVLPKLLTSFTESPEMENLENFDLQKYENVLGILGKLGEKGHI